MKITETFEVPTHTVTRQTHMVCDLCGAKSKSVSDWAAPPYRTAETTLKVTVTEQSGSHDPDGGGSAIGHEIDLCPTCFKDRLIPWLRSQGVKVEAKEWDW